MKCILFINPASGKGNSMQIIETKKKELDERYKNIQYIQTLYNGFIEYYISKNLTEFRNSESIAIIGVGGDGILFEIINSLQKFDLDIPIGIIPTGSGNGYFKSISFEEDKEYSIQTSLNILENINIKKKDLLYVKNLNKYMSLGVAWGIISDLDIYSEYLRRLGGIRFIIGAFIGILRYKSYIGILRYKNEMNQWIEVTGNFIYFWACNISHGSYDIKCSPGAESDDGYIYISYVNEDISRYQLSKILLGLFSGTHIENPYVKYIKTTEFKLDIDEGILTLDGELSEVKHIEVVNISKKMKFLS